MTDGACCAQERGAGVQWCSARALWQGRMPAKVAMRPSVCPRERCSVEELVPSSTERTVLIESSEVNLATISSNGAPGLSFSEVKWRSRRWRSVAGASSPVAGFSLYCLTTHRRPLA